MDVSRVARVGLDFFSQLIDEDAQVFGFLSVVRTPNSLQQTAVAQGLSLLGDEMAEQFKFFWGETDGVAFDGDGALGEINFQIIREKGGCSYGGGCVAESRADASHQFLGAERLDDIIVGAGIEGLDFVAFGVANGEHDDGDVARLANFAADVQAGHAGHVDVEKNQGGVIGAKLFEGLFACLGFEDGVALGAESCADDAANLRLVIHDHDGGGNHEAPARERSMGRVKEKTEPWPRWLVRDIEPPWASTMALAMGRPMPVPSTRKR